MLLMKNVLLSFLLLILVGEVVALFSMNKEKPHKEILAVATIYETILPSPTLAPVIVVTPSPTPNPTPTKSPVPTLPPQPIFSSEQINGFIDRFSAQYGVSPDILRYVALCESGFNPTAFNLNYAGLFQFGPVTWKNMRIKMGEDGDIDLRFNAEEAVQTASYVISIGKTDIWPNCYP